MNTFSLLDNTSVSPNLSPFCPLCFGGTPFLRCLYAQGVNPPGVLNGVMETRTAVNTLRTYGVEFS